MNLRLMLFRLAAQRGLSPVDTHRLQDLAGHDTEPAGLPTHLPRVLGVLAAALAGFGLILWIAANWASLSRAGRFGLLEAVVLVAGLGAWLKPALRAPLALFAFLGIGALFALFGQTYQTGADPWQLFAVWALLGLPLCLAVRSDIVWAPWVIVAMTAVSLWGLTHRHHEFWGAVRSQNIAIDLQCWLLSFALVLGLSRPFKHYTGAGIWSLRIAITLAIVPVAFSAMAGVFGRLSVAYPAGLLVLVGLLVLLAQRRAFDVYAFSIVALSVDVLLICGVASFMFDGLRGEIIFSSLILTAVSVGLLTASVKGVLYLVRTHGTTGEAP